MVTMTAYWSESRPKGLYPSSPAQRPVASKQSYAHQTLPGSQHSLTLAWASVTRGGPLSPWWLDSWEQDWMLTAVGSVPWGHSAAAVVAAVSTGKSGVEDCGRRSHRAVVQQGLYAVGGARNQYRASPADPNGWTQAVEGMGCSEHPARCCSMVHPPQDVLLQYYQQQCNEVWHLQYTTLLLTVHWHHKSHVHRHRLWEVTSYIWSLNIFRPWICCVCSEIVSHPTRSEEFESYIR